ncbi:MAG: outer membrane lipoprotein carrier protein LolA [Bacteroides sp.]|nr:outer membrane lipoprotein carrier protein LolA [Bacteroides sp.]MCM1555790.1 outer membrane lipoprotein carrier protein LolA [Bacteroides sp.]
MKRKFLVWICFALLAVMPSLLVAQEQASAWKTFEEELLRKNSGVKTISCRFEQIREASVLKDVVRKTGTFHYKRPDNIRLAFSDGDDITMNGEYFRITSSGKTSVVKMQSNPMLKEIKRILSACMTADLSALTAGFTPELEEKDAQYELILTPRRNNNMRSLSLVFSKKDMSLDEMRMTEPSGDYTLYRFSGKRFDVPVADELFKIGK